MTSSRSLAALAARRRHPMAGGLLVLLALVLTGGLYAVLSSTGSAGASSADGDPQQIANGRHLYLEGCSSCHGLNAQGVAAGNTGNDFAGPSLVGVGAAAVDFQVGTGRMPASQPGAQIQAKPVQYTQEQIDALAAYVASLGPGPAVPSQSDLDGINAAAIPAGGELFRTNCAQCHNFAGAGGALTEGKEAPAIRDISDRHIWEAMLTGPQSMPVFSDNTVTPAEKQQLIAFIQHLQNSPNPGGLSLGRLGPVPEGLFIWVVGFGAVTLVAVWIGVRSS